MTGSMDWKYRYKNGWHWISEQKKKSKVELTNQNTQKIELVQPVRIKNQVNKVYIENSIEIWNIYCHY